MKGTYVKKTHSFKGYCIIGDVSLPGNMFASSENNFVNSIDE